LRILFLAFRDFLNPFAAGGDIYINEMAKGCKRRGHSVTIISSWIPGFRKEEFSEGIHIIRLGNGFTMFAEVFMYYSKYLRKSFDVVVEEIIGGPRIPFLASIYVREKLVGILHQRHKRIFQHQFSPPIAGFLSVMERFLPLPYRSRTIVVNSLATKSDLHQVGFLEKQMRVIHPGVSEQLADVDDLEFSKRSPRVVCLAKARRYKLIDVAIRAMKDVCKVMPKCEMVVAGKTSDVDTKYEEGLRCLVEELDLSRNVFFRKDISEIEKIELLRTSRALVLPSAIEGFGIVVIEANSCGTPAIVSDRVPRDAAVDGYNAIVVPCYEVDPLSTAILSLMSDEEMWTKMSDNASKWAKKFTWDRSVEDLLRVIENA
jgi:glycosyltransferase involved in cell wall biosynthesis